METCVSDNALPTRMEATASIGIPDVEIHPNEFLQFDSGLAADGNASCNGQSSTLCLHKNGSLESMGQLHKSNEREPPTVYSVENRSPGLTRGSHDASQSTPNESTTSTSLTPTFSQKNPGLSPTVSSLSSAESKQACTKVDFDPTKYRPRSSIPTRLSSALYGQQCVTAAYSSRLNPYALHRKEQEALQDYLCHLHVTVYLNIRNGILRLWTRNPMVSVTKEEALGCAKDYRWMNLASFAYEWLVRNGYINFGCVEIPPALVPNKHRRRKEGPVIVVVGAGMAGLGCARQLEGLFRHYHDSFTSARVIVLEGRRRIGGRIYSHPLHSLQSKELAPGLKPKVEMGAQIVVGFGRGNPLDQIIRGQLGLPYHLLRDISTIYDIDGSPVHEDQDMMDETIYNDVLDRSGFYRHKAVISPTAEGDRELIDWGRDSSLNDGLTVRQYEEARAAGTIGLLLPSKRQRRGVGHKAAEVRSAGATRIDSGLPEEHPAALACRTMGWKLNDGVSLNDSLDLDAVAKASETQTLGAVMDEGVKQYQRLLPLSSKDMRLLNWHFANLEYANAANVNKLSLSGWDQDMGNEFEGEHSQVVGGYQQVPYALWSFPTKLDVRTGKTVSRISYDPTDSDSHKTMVHCEDGETIASDRVVFTSSLGVLKHNSVEFDPPLPDWKAGAIERLGFGLMNKVILVFDKPFWDTERDMFGLLREPHNKDSMEQEDYSTNRGRFYLFWNCLRTTGLPVLVALMAGDAAHQTEYIPDAEILAEVTSQLRNVFKHVAVPDPLETIISRWASDKFTRGSYSFVAAQARPGDYDLMAKPVGNLHFAGEATCGTHPATVHGAYLSGLRAASEVIESATGPIEIPQPLVPEKSKTVDPNPTDNNSTAHSLTSTPAPATGRKRKHHNHDHNQNQNQNQQPQFQFQTQNTRQSTYEKALTAAIHNHLGPPPPRPARTGLNAFLLYQKDYWQKCRVQCDEARRAATNNPDAKAPRDEVRHALGLMWRVAPAEERAPYIQQTEVNRQVNLQVLGRWRRDLESWEGRAKEVREGWCREHPFEEWSGSGSGSGSGEG